VGRIERNITEYLRSTGWAILLALLKAPRWTPHPGRARAARARDHLRGELLRLVAERRAAAASTTAGLRGSGGTNPAARPTTDAVLLRTLCVPHAVGRLLMVGGTL
jgi:hypothetical protein